MSATRSNFHRGCERQRVGAREFPVSGFGFRVEEASDQKLGIRNPKPARPLAGARGHTAGRQAGFALLITITLLAFIVVLLVGLAAYTRIETAVAGNTQRQAQARENALMALNVALGQLQQYAGPDQRVTATAEAFANANGTSRYTGVWSSDPAASTTPATPLTWLVSGNELRDAEGVAQPLAVTPDSAGPAASLIELVGRNTTGSTSVNANYIRAPLRPITVRGLPSAPATADVTIGRYAWWVGDQGVKAPVAVPDTADAINYPPYDSAELRSRIRQQLALGAGAVNDAGAPLFDPRESNNASLVANEKITAFNQLAFLRRSGSTTTTVGQALIRTNFHTWSPNNLNVLANTKSGGLRQDLSLAPGLLGSAFEAWANYPAYTESYVPPPPEEAGSEDPAPASRSILPAYSSDPIRRRYPIQLEAANGVRITPVLSYFHLLFGVRKDRADAPYQLSLRWAAALWNPYTSALVPEDLVLEISGLPSSIIVADATTDPAVDDATFDLKQIYGDILTITLPWAPVSSTEPQERSWLPGRVYNWTFEPEMTFTRDQPSHGRFNSRNIAAFDKGLVVNVPGGATIGGSTKIALKLPEATTLVLRLKRSNGDVLGTFSSPAFEEVPLTEPRDANASSSQFRFIFWMPEGRDTVAAANGWLTTLGRDPRAEVLPATTYIPWNINPSAPTNSTEEEKEDRIRRPERLLDRDPTDGGSFNEDVPVFELPRRPLLSLGELQHLHLPGARPFAIGNSWGTGQEINGILAGQLFDRFFFSGVAAQASPAANSAGDLVLPNPLLRLPRKPDKTKVTADEFRAAPDAFSSKHLLQAGAFNLNSTNPAAWASVLRGVRFPMAPGFTYLDADPNTGTAADTTASLQSTSAQFFRFPQSAQEVYKADENYIQSSPNADDAAKSNTHLFRQGMRELDSARLDALATRITELIRAKHADSGPFRTLEEFLSPQQVFAIPGTPPADGEEPPPGQPRSLLEAAIEDAGINSAIAEFSSQWLTQGDIMTALAPVLFPRSDTFVIRAYGEAINPAKLNNNGTVPNTAIEGRAWCEAIVQRVPEFMDPSVPPETPLATFSVPADPEDPESTPTEASRLNATYGRRFKVVSFRWLTRADI